MVNQNDILAALQNGEDPQVIANKFADALNAAIKQKADADAEKERQAKAAASKEAYAGRVLDAIFDMMENCYPDEYDPDMRKVIKAKAVAEAMDSTMKDFRRINGAFKSLEALVNSLEEEHTTPRTRVTVKEKNIDPLDAFLKANGLKN